MPRFSLKQYLCEFARRQLGWTVYRTAGQRRRRQQHSRYAAKFAQVSIERLENRCLLSAVTSVTTSGPGITAGNGHLHAGIPVTFSVNFDAAVTVDGTSGLPTLSLNNGGTASYIGGSGSSALKFLYTVLPEQNSNDLAVSAFNLNGSTIKSGGLNADLSAAVTNPAGTLEIQTFPPRGAGIVLVGNATQPAGSSLLFQVFFNGPVNNLDVNSFSLTTTGSITGASITNVTFGLSAPFYNVTVNSGSGTGTIRLNFIGNNITNQEGNTLGGGVFNTASIVPVGSSPYSVAVADIDGDGKADVVTANRDSNNVSVALGAGDGTFGNATNFSVGSGPVSVSLADVNNDGRPDIITANTFDNTVSVLLNTSGGSFAAATSFTTGASPFSVAVADVNGDGRLDIVTANLGDNDVSVLLSSGNGNFLAPTNLPVGVAPISVAVGDLNGDGKADIVVANQGDNNVSVLLGSGGGSFATATNFAVGAGPGSVAIADINHDHKLDLVTANLIDNSVSILNGDGTGGFATAVNYATGTAPISVAVADLNGDGRLDIATANLSDNSVSELFNSGTGTMGAPTAIPVGANPQSLALADVNGDGRPDLVTANLSDNTVSVLTNSNPPLAGPTVTLTGPAVSPQVTSVVASGVGITAGDGNRHAGQAVTLTVNFDSIVNVDSTFGLPTLSLNDNGVASYAGGSGTTALAFTYIVAPGQNTSDLAVNVMNLNGADIIGNGVAADVSAAAINPAGTLAIDTVAPTVAISLVGAANQLPGSTLQFAVTFSELVSGVDAGAFSLATTGGITGASISNVTPGVDAAHYLVSVSSGSGGGTIGLNITGGKIQDLAGNGFGGGTFTAANSFATGTSPFDVVMADVNGDGVADIVTANRTENDVSVLLGTGNGSFSAPTNFAVAANPASVSVADVNGDGKPDIVTANYGDGSVSVLLGAGDGSFGAATNFAVGALPTSVAIADVNRDGRLDIVTSNLNDNTVSVLLGNGDGNFSTATNLTVGANPFSVAVADVNGDGKADIVTANYTDNNVSVLLGDGTGGFSTATNFATGANPVSVAVADLNGDGKPDIVAANLADNDVTVLLGTGTGNFVLVGTLATATGPFSVAVADVNGDGQPDIVTSNPNSNNVSVLLRNGANTFASAVNLFVGTSPQAVAVGDLNGDGRPDMVTANAGNNGVEVLLNGNSSQSGPVFTLNAAPAVASITTSGLGITAGTGNLHAGQAVTLTVNFTTAVTVDGTNGLPTLALNDGRLAAYTGGSGTAALTFQYIVAAGDNTADLAVTALNLNGAKIQANSLNALLGGAATNPAGTLQIDTIAPTATIALIGSSSQDSGSDLQFAVTFSENVTGVDTTSFFQTTTGGIVGNQVTKVVQGVDEAHYTVTVNSGSGAGTIALGITGGAVKDLAGNGFGGMNFSQPTTYSVGNFPTSVAVGDLNGDGVPDIVTANRVSGTVTVRLGTGSGNFGPATDYAAGADPASVTLADVNADGKLDIVAYEINGPAEVDVLLGAGDGTFASATGVATASTGFSVAVADVNGDGKPDLVTANFNSTGVSVLLGTGTGSFGPATTFAAGSMSSSVAVGDVNGDGKPDLVVANYGSGNISVLLGAGDGSFGAPTNFGVGTSPFSVALADFNGDGKLDVVTANSSSNNVSVLLGNGAGSFGTAKNYATNALPLRVAVGDVNGDGKSDIVVTSYSTSVDSILLGAGDGTFAQAINLPIGSSAYAVALADVSGDGRLDFITATGSNNVTVILNGSYLQQGPAYTLTAATTTTLMTSVSPAVIGQSVTFTATVSVGNVGTPTPTGTVTFSDGNTVLGTGTLDNSGKATLTTSNLSVGNHSITASYGGDANSKSSQSSALTQVIEKITTTVSIGSSVPTSYFGQSVTFTATLAVVSPGTGTPTGTVTFRDGNTVLATGTVDVNGKATFTTPDLPAGNHSITASYGGDANFKTSSSSAATQVVTKLNTATSITSSIANTSFGQAVTFTATVAVVAPGTRTPTPNVTFKDGNTTIGTGTIQTINGKQVAVLTTSSLSVGTHSISAVFNGDTNFNGSSSGSVTQKVSQAGTITTIKSSNPNALFGQAVTFIATVSVTGPGTIAPVPIVKFTNGTDVWDGTLSMVDGKQVATYTTFKLPLGTESISAMFVGDTNFAASQSASITQVVMANTSTSTSSSAPLAVFGQSVTLTATVAVVKPAVGLPTGQVTFKEGNQVLGTGTLDGSGKATLTISNLSVGSHQIYASYGGDANFRPSVSVITQTIGRAATTAKVATSSASTVFGQSVTFTASVAVASPGNGKPTGTVTFKDGTKVLATVAIDANGKAIYSTSSLPVGSHSITVIYNGDANFKASVQSSVTQTVNKATTSSTVVASNLTPVLHRPVSLTATIGAVGPGAGIPTGTVTFKDGNTTLTTLSLDKNGKVIFTTSKLSKGTHKITVVYNGDANFKGSTSQAITITVTVV